jgi:FixJ family two-component response regulator
MKSDAKHRRAITVSEQELATRCARGRVVIIDDDMEVLSALAALIEFLGYACETYPSATSYLQMLNYNRPCFPGPCCILCDVKMPELDGLQLQSMLAELNDTPILLMSGASGAQEAVSAFHGGALDFLIKPINDEILIAAVAKALAASTERNSLLERKARLSARIATLTEREQNIARWVAAGHTNQMIAETLGIALRTVKLHRQRAMEKIGAVKTTDLVRIADEVNL